MSDNLKGYRSKFVRVKTSKKRTISSNKWLKRQLNDPYVSKARLDGYRSRAAYKLLEIHEKFKLFKSDMKIVDLGAAPGGWSQVAANFTKSTDSDSNSKIISVDLLEIEPIAGVDFFQKDFFDQETEEMIIEALSGKADIVMSDMASNTTGHKATDHTRTLFLCEQAFDFALKILKPHGHFIAKIFRGGTETELLTKVKLNFSLVKHFKPSSSRKESTEIYLVALNKRNIDTK
ncbi:MULTISPECIES: RlmE family RNA methyltransferase [unclassified Rickettsia]|jgi:23S rRNA (uridine2552-2'-O)-methyltransferase|uniref:RlmE family RNA methyltransferase n=1 Tax=unclassified Rickettsia TaxID=114295 RepID=UPI003132E22E